MKFPDRQPVFVQVMPATETHPARYAPDFAKVDQGDGTIGHFFAKPFGYFWVCSRITDVHGFTLVPMEVQDGHWIGDKNCDSKSLVRFEWDSDEEYQKILGENEELHRYNEICSLSGTAGYYISPKDKPGTVLRYTAIWRS